MNRRHAVTLDCGNVRSIRFINWQRRRADYPFGVVVADGSSVLHLAGIWTSKAVCWGNLPLDALHICVAFSKKTCEVYLVQWQAKTLQSCYPTASYLRLLPSHTGPKFTMQSTIRFSIQLVKLDQLSQVATRHQMLAESYESGRFHDIVSSSPCSTLPGLIAPDSASWFFVLVLRVENIYSIPITLARSRMVNN